MIIQFSKGFLCDDSMLHQYSSTMLGRENDFQPPLLGMLLVVPFRRKKKTLRTLATGLCMFNKRGIESGGEALVWGFVLF